MFNKKILKKLEELEKRLDKLEPTKKEETKEEIEHKERIEKAWQELFNYNERIAIKGE